MKTQYAISSTPAPINTSLRLPERLFQASQELRTGSSSCGRYIAFNYGAPTAHCSPPVCGWTAEPWFLLHKLRQTIYFPRGARRGRRQDGRLLPRGGPSRRREPAVPVPSGGDRPARAPPAPRRRRHPLLLRLPPRRPPRARRRRGLRPGGEDGGHAGHVRGPGPLVGGQVLRHVAGGPGGGRAGGARHRRHQADGLQERAPYRLADAAVHRRRSAPRPGLRLRGVPPEGVPLRRVHVPQHGPGARVRGGDGGRQRRQQAHFARCLPYRHGRVGQGSRRLQAPRHQARRPAGVPRPAVRAHPVGAQETCRRPLVGRRKGIGYLNILFPIDPLDTA